MREGAPWMLREEAMQGGERERDRHWSNVSVSVSVWDCKYMSQSCSNQARPKNVILSVWEFFYLHFPPLRRLLRAAWGKGDMESTQIEIIALNHLIPQSWRVQHKVKVRGGFNSLKSFSGMIYWRMILSIRMFISDQWLKIASGRSWKSL